MNELISNLQKSKVLRKLYLSENPEEGGRQQFHRMANFSKMFSQIVKWNIKWIKFWRCSLGLSVPPDSNQLYSVLKSRGKIHMWYTMYIVKNQIKFPFYTQSETGGWFLTSLGLWNDFIKLSIAARLVPQLLLLPPSTLLVWM